MRRDCRLPDTGRRGDWLHELVQFHVGRLSAGAQFPLTKTGAVVEGNTEGTEPSQSAVYMEGPRDPPTPNPSTEWPVGD